MLLNTIGGQAINWLHVGVGGLVTLTLTAVLVWVVTRMLKSEKVYLWFISVNVSTRNFPCMIH